MQLRTVLFALLSLALALPARATDVQGNININTHWTTSGSPYRLLGDVTVAPQATLTIDPGVQIQVAGSDSMASGTNASKVELIVQGTLTANGTSANPIVFKGASSGHDSWYGITFDVGAKASSLTYATISDTTTALWFRSTTASTFSDIDIALSTTGVLWQSNATANLARFEISFPKTYGIRLEDSGAGGVTATVSEAFIYVGDPNSIGVSLKDRVNATVKRSRIVQVGTGVRLEAGGSLVLSNNVVAGCYQTGVKLAQSGTAPVSVLNNTIDHNSYGGASNCGLLIDQVSAAPQFIVRNNLITNNGTGFKVTGTTAPSDDHNDVWGNSTNYTNMTASPTSISTNPLYVLPMSNTAPANATYVTGPNLTVSGSGTYSSSTNSIEVPNATLIRLKGSWTRNSSCYAYIYDRSGATLAYWSSSQSNQVISIVGNYVKFMEACNSYYSGYGFNGTTDYVAASTWNYRLQSSSPVIDKGNDLGAPTEDGDGTNRPVDGDVNGTPTTDLGAYEFHENYPPTVNAGADKTVKPGDTVTFDSTGTVDPDGTIASWDWDFGDSSTHATTANPTHTYASVGDYTVKLTVTDNLGASNSDTMVVHVKNNLPPTANAGQDILNAQVGVAVNFDGRASTDSDGTIVGYDWDFGDGTPHASNPAPTHTYARNAVFQVTLTVTDNQGATGTAKINVVVGSGGSTNHAPTANAGNSQTVNLGTAVNLSGAGSTDADGASDIASYSWDFGDGTAKGSGVTVSHTYAQAATYIVTLTVTDKAGASGSATVGITVVAPTNKSPVAHAGGPYSASVNQAVSFDGSTSTDPDGTIAKYDWDFGDGTNGTGAKPTHTYTSASSFLVRLTVTDDKGATATDSVLASIIAPNNRPPVANAGGPYSANKGSPLLFDGTKSADPDGSLASYHWDFGDGASADGDKVSHTYSAGGSFLVRLTVADDKGATDDDAVLATITVPGNQPPVAKAGGNRSAHVNESIVFDAAGSTDSDGTITQWLWDFGDGTTATTGRATHAFVEAGSYLVKLTVTDDKGAIGQDIALVSVGAAPQGNQPPVARAGSDVKANVGQKVVFNGAGSTDPDGTIVAYQWDFGDGDTAAGLSSSHTYDAAGSYTVTLTVFDDKGARASSTLTATVNGLPVPDLGEDRLAKVGQKLTFDASASTDDGSIEAYKWSFGDGEKAEGATAQHTYADAGIYTVTLELTDDQGAKAIGKVKVTVTEEQKTSTPAPQESGCGCNAPGAGAESLLGLGGLLAALIRRRR